MESNTLSGGYAAVAGQQVGTPQAPRLTEALSRAHDIASMMTERAESIYAQIGGGIPASPMGSATMSGPPNAVDTACSLSVRLEHLDQLLVQINQRI